VVPPVLPPIDANAMLRDGFNRALAHHEAWVTLRAKLLAAVIKSVLPQDLMALRDPQHAFLLLTLPNLLAHIKTVHGTVTAVDLILSNEGRIVAEVGLTSRLPQPCSPLC
jgi:hypothetical protein